MSAVLFDPDFPHGTVQGFNAGCRGSQCPAPVDCRTVHMRYSGDYSFRQRINAGMSVAEIHELEVAEAAEGAALVAAARRSEREAERATASRTIRPRAQRTERMSPEEREHNRNARYEQRKAVNATERERKRLERESMTAEQKANRAAELSASRAARQAERHVAMAARKAERALLHTAKPIDHGTNAGYARGCTCEPCGDAHRIYHREYAARRRAEGVAEIYHGTPYGYQLGCKNRIHCPAETSCADASLSEERRRRRDQGIPERELVPAEPVRAHILELHKTMPYTRIGELAGVAPKDVRRMVTGRDDGPRKGELPQHTERTKAERIMAVTGAHA